MRMLLLFLILPVSLLGADENFQPILDLQKNGKLFDKNEYKNVRGTASRLYEKRHEGVIKEAYGDDAGALTSWFEKNRDIKEELYTAIDWEKDDSLQVLKLFRELWKHSPEAVAKYPNLAIAISVVWDNPRYLYDYRGHQVRTASKLPEGYLEYKAVDEFKYFVDHQKQIKGKEPFDRLQVLPWEFQIYMVDCRTPHGEREWALKNYIDKRKMIGKIYHDIEYDNEMLRTQSKVCRLNGKDYTLQDIRKYGGVCAMQADFAARVSKSMAVPASYVSAESKFKQPHAWVMWVEVQAATDKTIKFTLESWGRYLGDNYYTGHLRNPQTGLKILDRDMERRLSAAAVDRIGSRQADLVMEFYNDYVAEAKPEVKAKIAYLDGALKLSNMNDAAWLELAKIVASGEVPTNLHESIHTHTNKLLTVFEKYPDFSWKIAGDLVSIQKDASIRNNFIDRLGKMYEKANRPDLACEARLKWAQSQIDNSKWQMAATGLNATILRFPDEGRFVPQLVAKLKEACSNYKAGNDLMAKTYVDLLRRIPPRRDDSVNPFYVQMARDASEFLKTEKKDKQLKEVEGMINANRINIDQQN